MVKAIEFEDSGTLFIGDSMETLKNLKSDSVDSCITSPPYWGLRDYGIEINPDYANMAAQRIYHAMNQIEIEEVTNGKQ